MLRPDIELRVARDSEVLRLAARLVEAVAPPARRLEPRALVETVAESLRLELDLRMEAAAISEIRYYAGLTRHIHGHFMEVEPGAYSATLREAAGVAGLIIPWNAPIVLLIRSLAPALAAGCTVVVKPAHQTAQITTRGD